MQYNYTTNTLTVFCAGCMATLILSGSPGMNVDKAIRVSGWNANEEGELCPKCDKPARLRS